MSGQGNNYVISGAKLLGVSTTINKYALFEAGGEEYINPCVNPNFQRSHIKGEVWELKDDAALETVDHLEGHPNWYVRTEIEV